MADLLLTKLTFSLVAGSMKGLTSCQTAQNMVGASYIHSFPSLNQSNMFRELGRHCLICAMKKECGNKVFWCCYCLWLYEATQL